MKCYLKFCFPDMIKMQMEGERVYASTATNLRSPRSIFLAKRGRRLERPGPFSPEEARHWESNRNASAWTVHVNAQAEQ